MKKFVISEQEKKNILKLYGVINESVRSELPNSIQKALSQLEKTYNVTIDDSHIQNELNQEGQYYEDKGRVNPKGLKQVMKLLKDLKDKFPMIGSDLKVTSDYRDYARQIKAFGKFLEKDGGVAGRQKYVALPGFSQHHTGDAFDILNVEPEWWDARPEIEKWVADNCSKYGFKLSYPSDGVLRKHEPWHLLYVGGESTTQVTTLSQNEVTDYFKSTRVDDNLEKNIVSQFPKNKCRASSSYTESPSIEDVDKGNTVIRIGHKGNPVEEVQDVLNSLNYDLGKCGVDGIFGPKTKNALELFQKDQGVTVSSSVDKETLEKLRAPGAAKPSQSSNSSSQSSLVSSSQSTTDNDYVIIKPDSYTGKDVHVFFGGAHSTKGSGANIPYLKRAGDVIKKHVNDIIIVLTHHANTLGEVKKYVKDKFDGNVVSIAGFSQGGVETWKHSTDSSLRIVGLIDPTTPKKDLDLGSNAILLAYPNNWGGNSRVDAVKERLKWYCENKDIAKYSGKVFCPDIRHWKFIEYFYQNYGSRV